MPGCKAGDLAAQDHCAHGDAGGNGFAHGDQVGFNAGVHVGEHLAGTGESALHFIQDQHGAMLAAQALGGLQEGRVGGVNAAFALHGFQNYGRGLVVDHGFHFFDVVVGEMVKLGHQGQEGGAVMFVPGGRKGAHGASVKTAHGGQNLLTAGGETGEF